MPGADIAVQNSIAVSGEEETVVEENEAVFYSDEQGVRVTSARLIVGPKTYAMRNITSVATRRTNPSYVGPVLSCLLGALFALIGFNAVSQSPGKVVLGIVLLVLGVFWAKIMKPDHHLRISSSAGDSSALESKNKNYIDGIVHAINEAIIHRG